ncbi:MAG: DoxX family protein [Candidatus Woesearchaeota archaeon]
MTIKLIRAWLRERKDWGSLVLRLFLGLGFLVAGLDKVMHIEMVSGMFNMLYGPAGMIMLYLAIAIEIVGGLLLLVGYQTRIAASVLAILIIVAFISTFKIGGMDFVSILREVMVMNTGGGNTAVNWAYFAGLAALAFGGSRGYALKPE